MRTNYLLFLHFGEGTLATLPVWTCNDNPLGKAQSRDNGRLVPMQQNKGSTISNRNDARRIQVLSCPDTIINAEMDDLFNTALFNKGEVSDATLLSVYKDNQTKLYCRFGAIRSVLLTNVVDWDPESAPSKCNSAKKMFYP